MLTGLPGPEPTLDTQPFWDGCQESKFLVPTCAEHGHPRWPPGPMCPTCSSTETRWVESSGTGAVYSWVVVNHPPHPILVDQVPYVVAMIDLPEGIRVVGNVWGCEPEDVRIDMAVELYFEDVDGFRRPNFRAA